MDRSGQFSLGYLCLMSFWIALTIAFSRNLIVFAMNVIEPPPLWSGLLALYGAMFCLSVVVGGFFKCMRAGAAVGFGMIVVNLGVAFILSLH